MKERSPQLSSDALNSLFAQLNPLDVEQFHTAYQLWNVQQRIQTQQALIDAIQRDIAENAAYLEQTHPSALALATLARLQANGVSDISLLDRMLERGEEWLDRTMQHLEYCENMDVISGDYTKWCEHALEGAYDWIDSMAGQETGEVTPSELSPSTSAIKEASESIAHEGSGEDGEPADESIEELFLQKLMSDDTETGENRESTANAENNEPIEDEASMPSMLETTLKIRAVSPLPEEDVPLETTAITPTSPIEDSVNATNDDSQVSTSLEMLPAEQETRSEAVEPTPVLEETQAMHTEETMVVIEEPLEQQQSSLNGEIESVETAQPATTMEAQQSAPINKQQTETVVEQEAVPPVITSTVDTGRNEFAPSTAPEVKQKKGFLRTAVAVLFHI